MHLVLRTRHFSTGCLERTSEKGAEGLIHLDDVTVSLFLGMWNDLELSPEDKKDLVLESLKADCEVHEDLERAFFSTRYSRVLNGLGYACFRR